MVDRVVFVPFWSAPCSTYYIKVVSGTLWLIKLSCTLYSYQAVQLYVSCQLIVKAKL
jgi:hypothetical protein